MNTQNFAGNVMSIIHSIFNKVNTSYTVIESHINKEISGDRSLSIVLLSRGGRPFRKRLLEDLLLSMTCCDFVYMFLKSTKGCLQKKKMNSVRR